MENKLNLNTDAMKLRYRSAAIGQRQIDELIGIIKGVLIDGEANQSEIEFILRWLEANQESSHDFPANVLYPRIRAAFTDGIIDPLEQAEITEMLYQAIGNDPNPPPEAMSNSTTLPLSQPKPNVTFAGMTYCFTGKFYAGSRDWCQRRVEALGGKAANSISKKVDFLVIGELGSDAWLHSTHGLKIQHAIELREAHGKPHIIDEQHWISIANPL